MNVPDSRNPSQSARRGGPAFATGVAAPAEAMPAIATSVRGTLSTKIIRQLAKWVSAPPRSGPMLKPSIRKPVHAPMAAVRRSGGAPVLTAASVPGTARAAAKPCRARPAISSACVPAAAMTQDAMASIASPSIDVRRAPNQSAAWPPGTMHAAATTR